MIENNLLKDEGKLPAVKQAIWLLITVVILFLLINMLAIFLQISLILSIFFLELSFLLPLIVFIKRFNLDPFKTLRIRKISFSILCLSVLIGVIMVSIEASIALLLFRETYPLQDITEKELSSLFPMSFFKLFILFLGGAILVPIVEELFFRGFLQRAYEEKGIKLSILYPALFFTIFHFDLYTIINLLIGSIIWGYIVYRTDSIFPSIIIHGVYNTSGGAIIYLTYGKGINIDSTIEAINIFIILLIGIGSIILLTLLLFFITKKTTPSPVPVPIKTPRERFSLALVISGFTLIAIVWFPIIFYKVTTIYDIHSNAMEPYLNKGDIVIIGRIDSMNEIERYDVIAYKKNNKTFIRRVIGLENEMVKIEFGDIFINGKVIKENYITKSAKLAIKVPSSSVFVLPDNRKILGDSQEVDREFIYVHKKELVGKVIKVIKLSHFKNFK